MHRHRKHFVRSALIILSSVIIQASLFMLSSIFMNLERSDKFILGFAEIILFLAVSIAIFILITFVFKIAAYIEISFSLIICTIIFLIIFRDIRMSGAYFCVSSMFVLFSSCCIALVETVKLNKNKLNIEESEKSAE